MKKPARAAFLFTVIAGLGAVAELGIAIAQQPTQQSIEEHMVDDTNGVLGVLRTWHNQISQDQAVIKALRAQVETLTKERDDLKAAQPVEAPSK